MRKQASVIEWTIAENDADWERRCILFLPSLAPAATRQRLLKRYFWSVSALLLLLASAGSWLWRTEQVRSHEAEAKAMVTAQMELLAVEQVGETAAASLPGDQTADDEGRQNAQGYSSLYAAVQLNEPDGQGDIAVSTVEFGGRRGIAQVVTNPKNGEPAYRQTRFYQRITTGWVQTAPDAALWGPERSLETPFFVFHFRERDTAAIIAVAPQLDALYTLLRHNLGLDLPPGAEKLVITVSVAQPLGQTAPRLPGSERFIVPSPAVYLAPVELTDAELLAQSIALPLIEHLLAQASEQHQIRAAWQPLLEGLRLWHVWDLDLPLSVWRPAVAQWLYGDLPATKSEEAIPLPADYTALCAAHKFWMTSPVQINIPLLCAGLAGEDFLLSPWGWYDPLTHLDQLGVPLRPGQHMEELESLHRGSHPGQTVALATLIDYAVETYGRERLPILVAGLGQYESWDTLLPAVYGVSPAEFEASWQAYLAAHYGVPLSSLPAQ